MRHLIDTQDVSPAELAALGRENHRGAPVAALVLTGVFATAVLLTGLRISDQDSLYFAIFAASSAVFLLPYILLYPAVALLRKQDPEHPRGSRSVTAMPVRLGCRFEADSPVTVVPAALAWPPHGGVPTQ